MNPKDRITRLEALLERVQGRKLDSREAAEPAGESPSTDENALLARELDAQAAAVSAAHSRELAAEELETDDLEDDDSDDEPEHKLNAETGWSIPVPRAEVPSAEMNGVSTAGLSGIPEVLRTELAGDLADLPSEPLLLIGDDATSLDDYEVAETVELDGDGEDDVIHLSKAPSAAAPPMAPPPSNPPEEDLLESRQRLVSAMPFEDDDEEIEARSIPLVQRRPSQIPPDFAGDRSEPDPAPPLAQQVEQLGELELIGEADAPPSSRRPIAQQLSDLDDFEQDLASPPPPAPPESGRQIAAQENMHDFEEDFVGGAMPMLEAMPMDDMAIGLEPISAVLPTPQDAMEMVLPVAQSPGEFVRSMDGRAPSAFPPDSSARGGLAPEIVHADLVSTTRVAAHEGSPPSFSPATFGELLDAALSL